MHKTLRRRRAFTLIELLVVIAIIGILAAMVFPVFARARESARKAVCLSNVKNIALAYQMYLADNNDTFFPRETTQAAEDFFVTCPGGGRTGPREDCNHKQHANPFIREQLLLDEYTKNRDVWRCPSAKLSKYARWIVPNYGPGGWLGYLMSTQGEWGRNDDVRCSGGPCCVAWPPGWGGTVTDSILQGLPSGENTGAFEISLGTTDVHEMKLVHIEDPVWYVLVADAGAQEQIWMASLVAYPDACRTGCGPSEPVAGCCSADWVECPDSQACGADWTIKKGFFNSEPAKRFTRHLGGSNIGFADGHAAWMSAGGIIAESPTYDDNDAGKIRGIGCIIPACDY
ncbi:MAG: prepilin-type N-terminal cleavage/methylation domain-containing protein [Armatimonadota bacterium]